MGRVNKYAAGLNKDRWETFGKRLECAHVMRHQQPLVLVREHQDLRIAPAGKADLLRRRKLDQRLEPPRRTRDAVAQILIRQEPRAAHRGEVSPWATFARERIRFKSGAFARSLS